MADDEILRLHAPLIVNRRVTTRPVELSGRHLDAGAPLGPLELERSSRSRRRCTATGPLRRKWLCER